MVNSQARLGMKDRVDGRWTGQIDGQDRLITIRPKFYHGKLEFFLSHLFNQGRPPYLGLFSSNAFVNPYQVMVYSGLGTNRVGQSVVLGSQVHLQLSYLTMTV